jgi:ribA/ribD-fused uncharacterized protein
MTTIIDRFDGTEYNFLSNFYPSPFMWESRKWPTVEHAFQAAKSPYRQDWEVIRQAKHPVYAKRLGQKVKLVDNWDQIRIFVMYETVFNKFKQNKKLAEKLLATGDALLIEGNTWGDCFWGQVNGVGENWLGQTLMRVRYLLKTSPELIG